MSTPRNWYPGPSLRIGDAERESAAQALGEHYAVGRLTRDEYDERAERVWAARTVADLRPLFADLPAPHAGTASSRLRSSAPQPPAQARPRPGRRLPLLPMLLIALGLVMLLDAPGAVILLLLGAWWWTMSLRWRRHWSSRSHVFGDSPRRRGC